MLQATTPPAAGTPGSTPATGTASVGTDIKKVWGSVTDEIKKAYEQATDFTSTWSKLDELSAEFVKNTGMGRERTIEMETSITQSATEILKFSKGIYTYEEALKRSAEIVGNISDATNRSLIGNAKEIEGIAVAMEATNVPSATLVKNFKDAGFSLSAIPKEMQKVTDYTRSIGVNTAEVSKGVVENLKNLNLYNFDNGIQGLTKMVSQSALFGVNMSNIYGLAEKMFDPEQAINMAASLQRLGVSTSALLDPLALMDMGQNNPAELQNQIVEMTKQFTYFDEKNQKFQILPGAQRQMREIGKELGIGADELARMALGSSELNKKMSEIRFPTLDTGPMSEEQKQMIANMSELRDGKYSVMVEQKDAQGFKTGIMEEKAITELSEEDIKTLSESSKPKAMEDIAKEQLTALNRIANAVTSTATAPKAGLFGSAGGQAVRRAGYNIESGAADKVGNLIKPGEIKELVNKMLPDFKTFAQQIASGDKEGAKKTGAKLDSQLGGMKDETIKRVMGLVGDTVKLTKDQIDMFTHAGNPSAQKTTTQTKTQTKQQQIQEPKSVGSAMNPKDLDEFVNKMSPNLNKLYEQMKGGGGDNKTEINGTLSKIGEVLGKSSMDDKTMKGFTDMLVDNAKLSKEQIKTLTDATKVSEKNPIQQQTTDQSKEQTGIANMIKPEEIKGLVEKMLPDFENLTKQMESGNTADAEKTSKDIESQLSKFGMDDKTMKMFTDLVGANTKLTEDQIKTLAKSSQITEKNETQQPQTQQSQTQSQTEGPKLSWMKQIDAFDKVTEGTAGETQTVTNSQVSDLNNQTVTATNNNQQQSTNQSDYLIDIISKALPPQTQIVEHKFDGTITIKVDVPPGVDSAYVTKTINDMVNSPAFTDKMMKSQEVMANNYGLTGGKVSAYSNSSGMGLG
jgi:hypothetical protein